MTTPDRAAPRTEAGREYAKRGVPVSAIIAIEDEEAAAERQRMPIDDVDFRTLLHDNDFSWDDANAVCAVLSGEDLVVKRLVRGRLSPPPVAAVAEDRLLDAEPYNSDRPEYRDEAGDRDRREARIAELEQAIRRFHDEWQGTEQGPDADARYNTAAYALFELVALPHTPESGT